MKAVLGPWSRDRPGPWYSTRGGVAEQEVESKVELDTEQEAECRVELKAEPAEQEARQSCKASGNHLG